MNLNSNVKKIVIKPDHELTDVIRQVKNAKEDRIVLTFTEKSDMLVSPINMKVLLEEADANSKLLVTQIIQNPAGIRNSKAAGIITTDSSGAVDEDMWSKAEETFSNRVAAFQSQLKSNRTTHQDTDTHADPEADIIVDLTDTVKNPVTEIEFEDQNPELTHVEELTTESSPDEMSDLQVDDMSHKAEEVAGEENTPDMQSQTNQPETAFSKRVNSAIKRSQEELIRKSSSKKVVSESGVAIALDSDIDDQSAGSANSMVGKDFNAMTPGGMAKAPSKIPAMSGAQMFKAPGGKATSGAKFNFANLKLPKINMAALKKKGPIVAIPIALVALFIVYIVYANAPFASAKIYIESRPVEVEESFTGKPDVTEFNVEDRMVQIKQEVVEKGRSDSRETTQTARRGEKADGIANVRCYLNGSLELAEGTVITAPNGLQFQTLATVTMICPWQETVAVEALAVGSEYNMQSGTLFSVPNYNVNQVVMQNDLSAFTGGSSEEYQVVGQVDIDNASKDLQESAFEEANSELQEMAKDGWKIIDSTIKNEVVGGVKSDYPVGAEAEIVNVSLETKSTALYYKEDEIKDVGEELLLEAAREQNLFDSDEDLELKLGDDILTEVSVEKVEDTTVTIKVKSSGSVKPDVDKNQIIADLKGMGWENGTKYLEDLNFTSKDPQYEFSPTWFPGFLWRFPSKQGRIKLVVEEVERPAEENTSEATEE
ncbi:MAG: baseplate J/gp47 family protein [Candidatus Dojkabacteria bacterium]|nr:MAG: baseplate J/gp47 family protein [Candidatus Dojkabacteria bacterium]